MNSKEKIGIVGLTIVVWFVGVLMGGLAIDAVRDEEMIREVEVPGPERIVEIEVPGPERIVEVPGPERVVEVEVIREVEVIKEVIVEVPARVEPNDLVVQGVTPGTNVFDWFVLRGEVLNTGDGIAQLVRVTGTFYSVAGDVLCVDSTFTTPQNLGPNEKAPFELNCTDEQIIPRIDSWVLAVD